MKTFKCYDCDDSFQAETKDEVLIFLYNHYMKDHKEIISNNTEAEKLAWMDTFDKDWARAPETSQ